MIHWKYPSKALLKFSFILNFLNVSRRSTRVLSLLNSLQTQKIGDNSVGFRETKKKKRVGSRGTEPEERFVEKNVVIWIDNYGASVAQLLTVCFA